MEPRYYFLKNKWTDDRDTEYVMDAADGRRAVGTPLIAYGRKTGGADNQLWALVVSEAPPYLYISSKLTGQVIDIESLDPKPGTLLNVYPQKGEETKNQLWRLVPSDETEQYFFVTSILNNLVITFPGASPVSKTQLTVSTRQSQNNDHQLWSFVRA